MGRIAKQHTYTMKLSRSKVTGEYEKLAEDNSELLPSTFSLIYEFLIQMHRDVIKAELGTWKNFNKWADQNISEREMLKRLKIMSIPGFELLYVTYESESDENTLAVKGYNNESKKDELKPVKYKLAVTVESKDESTLLPDSDLEDFMKKYATKIFDIIMPNHKFITIGSTKFTSAEKKAKKDIKRRIEKKEQRATLEAEKEKQRIERVKAREKREKEKQRAKEERIKAMKAKKDAAAKKVKQASATKSKNTKKSGKKNLKTERVKTLLEIFNEDI